jgi:hypothetical protein
MLYYIILYLYCMISYYIILCYILYYIILYYIIYIYILRRGGAKLQHTNHKSQTPSACEYAAFTLQRRESRAAAIPHTSSGPILAHMRHKLPAACGNDIPHPAAMTYLIMLYYIILCCYILLLATRWSQAPTHKSQTPLTCEFSGANH